MREALARAGVPASPPSAPWSSPSAAAGASSRINAARPLNPASAIKLVTTFAGARPARPRLHLQDRRARRRASSPAACSTATSCSRGGGDPKLTYDRLWQLAAPAARARPARDPRRRDPRPQLLRAGRATTPRTSTTSRAAPTTSAPTRCSSTSRPSTSASFPRRARCARACDPDLPSIELHTRLKLVEGAVRRLAATASSTRSTSRTCSRRCGLGQLSGRAAARRAWPLSLFDADRYAVGDLPLALERAGRALRRQGARRAARRTTPSCSIAFESEPLANLVRDINKYLQQRDGAAGLPHALGGAAGAPGEAQASDARSRRWLKGRGLDSRNSCWRTARGFRAASGSRRGTWRRCCRTRGRAR